MSHLLWKHFYEDDVDKFRHLLAPAGHTYQTPARHGGVGSFSGSPVSLGTSPRATAKSRKFSRYSPGPTSSKNTGTGLGKTEVNFRDHMGLTVLLRASSSTSPSAIHFVQALLGHPGVDIYAQDPESGWNALHRALYNGNIAIARLLLETERRDLTELALGPSSSRAGCLIKTKDKEGNSPFDVYNETIGHRILKDPTTSNPLDTESESGDSDDSFENGRSSSDTQLPPDGEELFVWGSNKNLSLGVGEDSDRQYPERIQLKRPDHLLFRFYREAMRNDAEEISSVDQLPDLIRYRPLVAHDVVMAKFSTAILTRDPVSNLYICGIGTGGRLGLGDENTQFRFAPIQGPLRDKRIVAVALADFHSMAATSNGELWTWGSNTCSQLGFSLPPTTKKGETPMITSPRQVFSTLKKEAVRGVAASRIHSIAHTATSVYCWGKNVGQLGIMDADSRSLEVQTVPRRVAASLFTCGISMVSAIEKATSVLLQNNTVCVFTQFGYNMVKFPFDELVNNASLNNISMSSRYDPQRHRIKSIASGGSSIVALTGRGDLFTCEIQSLSETSEGTSTTNPTKIKNALSKPQCVWVANKDGVSSASVGESGSVIISTESGACWRRVKRQTPKTGYPLGPAAKRRDFKFQRVPYITNIVAVRSSTFGAFSAIRKDNDVMKQQIDIAEPSLWRDVRSLCFLEGFEAPGGLNLSPNAIHLKPNEMKTVGTLISQLLVSSDLELDIATHLRFRTINREGMDVILRTSSSPDIELPAHGFMLAARSPTLRAAFSEYRNTGYYIDPHELFSIGRKGSLLSIMFVGVDILSLINMVVFAYRDAVVPIWNFARQKPHMAYHYRQVRLEVMKMASVLGMTGLEDAARLQLPAASTLDADFHKALSDPAFFEDADIWLELENDVVLAHSTFLCRRSPFFEGLFHGRSRGAWLEGRREQDPDDRIPIDFTHMSRQAFDLVLRYLYTDIGAEIFDSLTSPSIDQFAEVALEVMGIANELMLDRLVQISQYVIGKFVTTRNISQLLNEISPCHVTEFKNTGLEYICLQMESMLENNLLDDLEVDLMEELDQKVRENQAAQLPVAKSNMADLELNDRYPYLAAEISEEHHIRVKEMAYITTRDEERRLSSAVKARYGSFDDLASTSPTAERERRKYRSIRNEPFSPTLRPQKSSHDLIFDMDEDGLGGECMSTTPVRSLDFCVRNQTRRLPLAVDHSLGWKGKEKEACGSIDTGSPLAYRQRQASLQMTNSTASLSTSQTKSSTPWTSSGLQPVKLGLKDIMSEASPGTSALTAGLAAQKKDQAPKMAQPKMSQKERKRQQQLQLEKVAEAEAAVLNPHSAWETAGAKPSPWKATQTAPRTNLKDFLSGTPESSRPAAVPQQKPIAAAESSAAKIAPRRTASPDTRFSGQSRKASAAAGPSRPAPSSSSAPIIPHSKNYITPAAKVEPALSLGLADIIGQQQREQELVREAVAKRSLQEIQQEQEFQEWWDQESRRTQEEEAARRVARESEKGERDKKGISGAGGRNRRRGGNLKPRGAEGRRGGVGGGGGGNAQGTNSGASGGGGSGGDGRQRGRGRPRAGRAATVSST
ncbi:BTB/POZ domain-containing protein 1 [Zalerion maritima]|uniref:BTB/POZ domain-containing protein 1 n=1 Tax=Zalerion maritima TaxID=339359 RepID=A0AAD5WV05_9PEZI|nr:BTB/POZ domain-containing protein 1 [Zalerion maritima]